MLIVESAPPFNPANRHNRGKAPPVSDLRRVHRRVPCADTGAALEICASYHDEHGTRETLWLQGHDPSVIARAARAAEQDRRIPAGRVIASDFETGWSTRQIAVRA